MQPARSYSIVPEGWEIALIGKNIGDKLTLGNCSAGAQNVGHIFPGVTTGGTSSGIAGPGREIWLRPEPF